MPFLWSSKRPTLDHSEDPASLGHSPSQPPAQISMENCLKKDEEAQAVEVHNGASLHSTDFDQYQCRHRDFVNHLSMSRPNRQLRPKMKRANSSPPVSSIQYQYNSKDDPLDASFSSSEAHPPTHRTSFTLGADQQHQQREEDRQHEEEWSKLFEKTPIVGQSLEEELQRNIPNGVNSVGNIISPTNPFAAGGLLQQLPYSTNNTNNPGQPKSILRRRLSSASLTSSQIKKRQASEMQSILSTLNDLQNNFVTNDNSTSSTSSTTHATNPAKQEKEFIIRNFPNGNLFSGNINSNTQELIYGRMTCALEMEVYEGPFVNGKRHGEGAICTKMDGSAKFLGRYHEGQMHSGTLIVTRNLPSDFTYTGTFLNNDFHGIGTIVSQNGSIYQGELAYGQYHGLGTLRTIVVNENARDEDDSHYRESDSSGGQGHTMSSPNKKNKKNTMESVYIGDFSEGVFHGHGSLTHSDGSSYIGTWSHGNRVEGTETLPNGDIFEGKFCNDVREGQGILRMKCGKVTKQGIWEKDCLKDGEDLNITFADGHVYCGDHFNSVPHGFGRMEYTSVGSSGESAYTGWFVNGMRQGEGLCFFHKTGEQYEGLWACDEPIGLKLFQHNGPLIKEVEGEDSGDDQQKDDKLQAIDCPPTSLTRRRSGNNDMNSSFVSAASGASVANTEESIALSSIEYQEQMNSSPNNYIAPSSSRRSSQRLRIGTADDSDNLSLSMKSLTVFDYSEQGLKMYKYQNGDIFKGHLDKNSLRQGSGVYTEHLMGTTYNGDWVDSKRHGVGHLQLASGLQYSGEFFMDQVHGQGNLTLIDGSVYTGSFFNGLFHGRGMLEDEGHKRVYFGEFENGERSGEGEEKFTDGSRYKGEYKNGKRNGIGVLFDSDDSEIYRGEWNDDLRHGSGRLSRHRQKGNPWEGSYDGDFFQDKFSGNGKFTYTDGTSIEGQWLDDIPRDGDWTISYPDGSQFYGFATFQHPEDKSLGSDLSRGSACDDYLRVPLPHGFGSLTYPSGRRFVGSFVYGEYNDGK